MAALNDTMRCMEDFIINPTVAVDEQSVLQTEMPQHKYLTKTHWYQQAGPSKAATLVMEASHEPTFWHAYTSDEEVASPVDNDSGSMRSRNSSVSSDFSLPELLADACSNVEQQCNRAQAITIRSAGRPRMISMPKPIDTSRRSISRPMSAEQQQSTHSRKGSDGQQSARSSQDSQSISSRHNSMSDSQGSPASTAPSSIYSEEPEPEPVKSETKHQRRISKHIDLMEAARAIPAATSPYQPPTPVLTRPATFDDSLRPESVASKPSSIVRKKAKFSSGLGLKGLGRNFSRRDSNIDHDDLESTEQYALTREVSYASSRRVSTQSARGSKMVARAANERAPTIQLPPFVDE